MAWEQLPENENKKKGSSIFIKMKSGDSVTGVLVGEPKIFYCEWVNGKPSKSEIEFQGSKRRFLSNFAVVENGTFVMKVFENSDNVYKKIAKLNAGGYELSETLLTITRDGERLDTEYSVLPSPHPLTDVQKDILVNLELHELKVGD